MSEKSRDNKGRLLQDGERQRKDGRYEFRYIDKEGNRRSVYSWKLTSTDRAPKGKSCPYSLRELEKEINRDLEEEIKTNDGKESLNFFFDKYIGTKFELKQSTRTNYKYMYDKFVRDEIGKKQISKIKYSDIKKFYIHLIQEYGLKLNTLEIVNTVVHPTFTMAVRDDIIRMNPSDGVMAEIKKTQEWNKPKRHALTIAQQEAFVNFCQNNENYRHWMPIFTVFLGTGGRVGEILGLRWQDIDFGESVISINHNLVYRVQDDGTCEFHITTPKTRTGEREIPMISAVRDALMSEYHRQMISGFNQTEIDGYSGFVFQNRDGGVFLPNSINRAIQRIYKAYNEEELARAEKEGRDPELLPHFTVHNLRHTFCTRFCENETNLKVIQEIMGHADITTTMEVYNEATKEAKKSSLNALEGKIKIS